MHEGLAYHLFREIEGEARFSLIPWDQLADILLYTTGLIIERMVKGRDANGFLGAGKRDAGRIQLDELQFLP